MSGLRRRAKAIARRQYVADGTWAMPAAGYPVRPYPAHWRHAARPAISPRAARVRPCDRHGNAIIPKPRPVKAAA